MLRYIEVITCHDCPYCNDFIEKAVCGKTGTTFVLERFTNQQDDCPLLYFSDIEDVRLKIRKDSE